MNKPVYSSESISTLPTDMFIEFNGTVVRLREDRIEHCLYIPLGNAYQIYEEHLDGAPLDIEEVKEKYPEVLI